MYSTAQLKHVALEFIDLQLMMQHIQGLQQKELRSSHSKPHQLGLQICNDCSHTTSFARYADIFIPL